MFENFNLWNFIFDIYEFFIQVGSKMWELWNWSFEVAGETFEFKKILTVSLLVIMALLLVKKLVPVA